MKSNHSVFFLLISALEHLSLVHGANYQQTSQETNQYLENQCKEYTMKNSDSIVRLNPAVDSIDKLKDTIKDLQVKLGIVEGQIKSKEDHLKEIGTLQIRLVNAECQVQIKNQIYIKDKEISEQTEQLKYKDQQIEYQKEEIKKKDDKINTLAATINNCQNQLVYAEGQIRIKDELISFKVEEIKVKTENLKCKEHLIESNDKQIMDQVEQIKNKAEEMNIISNQLKDVKAQVASKNNQIDGLNSHIKTVSEELTARLLKCNPPESCPSGIYNISNQRMPLFKVPCSLDGWMVIQRRQDGSENFTRNWQEYKDGFGDVRGEFFIGLEKIYQLTNADPHELSIKLGSVNGVYKYAHYDNFKIGSEKEFYELQLLGKYSGAAGDSLTHHRMAKFSTIDRDNDASSLDCAKKYSSGWWFVDCFKSSLNGKYHLSGTSAFGEGVNWHLWNEDYTTSLTFVEIIIRPKLYRK
uniref:Fibrinogen-like protein 1 isoform X1 n=2 Tax=Drosophila rhopaloa TaxID=1041015 RepID=A0A6P4FGD3_DRORH